MKSILIAFDFGMKNIGVAVGQSVTCTAAPLLVIKAKRGNPNWLIIERLIKEWHPEKIIVGLSLNMDGSEQLITKRCRDFANKLYNRFSISVKLHDERLSTVEAKLVLLERGGLRELNKNSINATSAAIILESFLKYRF